MERKRHQRLKSISINLFCFHHNVRRRGRRQAYLYVHVQYSTVQANRDHLPPELARSKFSHTTKRRRETPRNPNQGNHANGR